MISALFFLSGLTSLIYEVVWQKRIMTALGSDVYATSMTLSAFMLGLALGSFLAGKVADRVSGRVLIYGFLELLIGVYAVSFPSILAFAGHPLHDLYVNYFGAASSVYWTFKFAIIFIVLMIPSAMMGATLPIVVAEFAVSEGHAGEEVSRFYSINTIGAFFGVLVSGFISIYMFGLSTTTWTAATLNFIIAGVAIVTHFARQKEDSIISKAGPSANIPLMVYGRSTARAAIVSAFFIGFCILALEVVWARMLIQYMAATVYSFSTMLLFVLLGIFLGARKSRSFIESGKELPEKYVLYIMLAGLYVSVSALLFYVFPNLYTNLVFAMLAVFKGNPDSWLFVSTVGKGLASAFFVLIPCVMSGMLFPMAVRMCTDSVEHAGGKLSSVYVANTAGSIIGPLAASFILIPAFGAKGAMIALALMLVAVGAGAVHYMGKRVEKSHLALAGAVIVLSLTAMLMPKKIVANYARPSKDTRLIYSREGVYQNINILKNQSGQTVFMIDGNVEADNSYLQLRHFVLKSHFPLLLNPKPDNALVIGLGLGLTTSYLESFPLVKWIDVIELSPEVVGAHAYIKDVNGGVLTKPKVHVIVDDGRNYLANTGKKYGIITIDPIHPMISGVGTLYTREFYELVKDRLADNGAFIQWMPSYHMSPESMKTAINTFAGVFKETAVIYVKGHFLLVGKKEGWKIDYALIKKNFNLGEKDLASIDVHSPVELLSLVAMTPDKVREYIGAFDKINTDDNLWLEYHVPYDYLHDIRSSVSSVFPFWGLSFGHISNASPDDIAEIQTEWEKRRAQVTPEMAKPIK
ncbi:MAG: hypothetical protein HZB29_01245 [Nitrospinae bacterium]|nr:hypothetical protein [Nitrospinota bacterium]